ncbi:class E sortase [Microbacterium caowuchunii]|uniref:Class E sortase n=1 Tax=Microbacterium caowuchunii TaxID=2614638 RepID=A0A5N0TH72_9MICO|nr:class E sortase [Microbacterium caowuchunii]
MSAVRPPESGSAGPSTRRGRRRRSRVSVVGVIGEVLLTAGVIAFLFVAWQMWIGDAIVGAQNNAEGSQLAEQWEQQYETASPDATPDPEATDPAAVTADPIAIPEAAEGETFGIMRIPRFGADYMVKLAGGVNASTSLNVGAIGHYPGTAMPGDVGNFAVAAHRGSHGAPFMNLPALQAGDAIVIETQDGWYTYRFRNSEYVTPDSVDVLLPVPRQDDVAADDRYITMTTCSPRYGFSERLAAYGVFESFTPRSAGEPAALTEAVA